MEVDSFVARMLAPLMNRHSAIIHYSPDPDDCDIIKKDQVRSSLQLYDIHY